MSLHRKRYPDLDEHYELHETLGTGGFAKVKAGIHKLTGEKVAVKIMDKIQLGADLPRVYREIRALRHLHHQHICQLYQVIETDKMIYMILEYCPGGELFDYIVAKEKLRAKEARSFFRQILAALHYVHENGYIHRDLKPENLLLDDDSNIKLIDFGLVAEPDDTQDLLQTCCGSPAYAAPELIRGGPYLGVQADVWSLGVLLYALLNGFLPFDDDHTPYLYRLIQRGVYEIPEWLSISSIAIIARLLQTDPQRRITVEKLLHHDWVMDGYDKPVDWSSKIDLTELDSDCVSELAYYHQKTEDAMKREILQWKYDEITVTYFLLVQQKLRGRTVTILEPPKSLSASSISDSSSSTLSHTVSPLATKSTLSNGQLSGGIEFSARKVWSMPSPPPPSPPPSPSLATKSTLSNGQLSGGIEFSVRKDNSSEEEEFLTPEWNSPHLPAKDYNKPESFVLDLKQVPQTSEYPFPRRRRPSIGQPMHPPVGEIVTLQRPLHPAILTIKDEGSPSASPCPSPTPYQHTHPPVSNTLSSPPIPISASMSFGKADRNVRAEPHPRERVKKTRSYDARLYQAIEMEHEIRVPLSPQLTPRRRRLGSIEGLIKKAKKAFKKNETSGPRRVKGIYDCSTTSLKPADIVLAELERVLQTMDVSYERKNYTLQCRIPNYKKDTKLKIIELELEVCILPRLNMIGVRRKRLRGDTWEYKRVVDQIFKATRL